MSHILRAHQLCMEGYSSLFDKHLSTVWSAPNYCYRCGNSASILEVGPGETMFFNVFEAAPENERDGPNQQGAQNASGKVTMPRLSPVDHPSSSIVSCFTLASGIFPVVLIRHNRISAFLDCNMFYVYSLIIWLSKVSLSSFGERRKLVTQQVKLAPPLRLVSQTYVAWQ